MVSGAGGMHLFFGKKPPDWWGGVKGLPAQLTVLNFRAQVCSRHLGGVFCFFSFIFFLAHTAWLALSRGGGCVKGCAAGQGCGVKCRNCLHHKEVEIMRLAFGGGVTMNKRRLPSCRGLLKYLPS